MRASCGPRRSHAMCFAVAAAALLLLLSAAIAPAAAQLVYGRVIDKVSGAGVPSVTMQMLDSGGAVHRETVTDTSGWFRLRAAAGGTYRVRAQVLGYAEVESAALSLDQAAQTEVEIVIDGQTIALEPVRVVAERSLRQGPLGEYFERAAWVRRSGLGRVYMRQDLEASGTHTLGYLLSVAGARPGCAMTYFLDGLPWDRALVEGLQVETVEGVEVYRSRLEVPAEYQRRVQCGAVIVWTRRDLPGRRTPWWRMGATILGLSALFLLLRGVFLGG
jgi:hypothetical protein